LDEDKWSVDCDTPAVTRYIQVTIIGSEDCEMASVTTCSCTGNSKRINSIIINDIKIIRNKCNVCSRRRRKAVVANVNPDDNGQYTRASENTSKQFLLLTAATEQTNTRYEKRTHRTSDIGERPGD